MKQVEVSILGQVYVLGCPEGGEAQLAKAVVTVDREMTAIRDAGKVKARERIAVLAALNLAYLMNDQAAKATAPNGTAASSVAAGSAATANNALGPAPNIDVQALIRRVDGALADDGRLL